MNKKKGDHTNKPKQHIEPNQAVKLNISFEEAMKKLLNTKKKK